MYDTPTHIIPQLLGFLSNLSNEELESYIRSLFKGQPTQRAALDAQHYCNTLARLAGVATYATITAQLPITKPARTQDKATAPENPLISVEAAAQQLGVTTRTVHNYLKAGKLNGRNLSTGKQRAFWKVYESSVAQLGK